jgi:hypothetical protein
MTLIARASGCGAVFWETASFEYYSRNLNGPGGRSATGEFSFLDSLRWSW